MNFSGKALYRALSVMLFILSILTTTKPIVAFRPLKGEKTIGGDSSVALTVNQLKRGPVPPAGPSPCTHIGGGSPGGHCRKL
ncbi:hypothetical protein WN943_016852 [Citrus x changshan-huyou]